MVRDDVMNHYLFTGPDDDGVVETKFTKPVKAGEVVKTFAEAKAVAKAHKSALITRDPGGWKVTY